jgi:pyruvate/oxaloacetate carboxyltransferase
MTRIKLISEDYVLVNRITKKPVEGYDTIYHYSSIIDMLNCNNDMRPKPNHEYISMTALPIEEQKKYLEYLNPIKGEIESMLIDIFDRIGIQTPSNFDDIVKFCVDDVRETADPENWHSGDVEIAFRRWIEKQGEK